MMADKGHVWEHMTQEFGLRPIALTTRLLGIRRVRLRTPYDTISDTTKARRYGFHDVVKTEEMFRGSPRNQGAKVHSLKASAASLPAKSPRSRVNRPDPIRPWRRPADCARLVARGRGCERPQGQLRWRRRILRRWSWNRRWYGPSAARQGLRREGKVSAAELIGLDPGVLPLDVNQPAVIVGGDAQLQGRASPPLELRLSSGRIHLRNPPASGMRYIERAVSTMSWWIRRPKRSGKPR